MLERFFGSEGDPQIPPKRGSTGSSDRRKSTLNKKVGPFTLTVISYARAKRPGVLIVKLTHSDKKIAEKYLRSESSFYADKVFRDLSDSISESFRTGGTEGVLDSLEGNTVDFDSVRSLNKGASDLKQFAERLKKQKELK